MMTIARVAAVIADSELEIVFAAARPLEVADRDLFLRDVAERLAALPRITREENFLNLSAAILPTLKR